MLQGVIGKRNYIYTYIYIILKTHQCTTSAVLIKKEEEL